MAYAGGPLVACIMFWQLGDDWSTEDCVMVMMVGLVMSIIPSILCFLFNDDKAIGKTGTYFIAVCSQTQLKPILTMW